MIVKMMLSVDKVKNTVATMASMVGDSALNKRMQDMTDLIIKGVVKTQSLYLEQEDE